MSVVLREYAFHLHNFSDGDGIKEHVSVYTANLPM
jgi:hypothetical protein